MTSLHVIGMAVSVGTSSELELDFSYAIGELYFRVTENLNLFNQVEEIALT